MASTIFRMVRSPLGRESAHHCRNCNEPIPRKDGFGISESVCEACRSA